MTKSELKERMITFINNLDDTHAEEWYNADKELAEIILTWFADELKIKLNTVG